MGISTIKKEKKNIASKNITKYRCTECTSFLTKWKKFDFISVKLFLPVFSVFLPNIIKSYKYC